MPFKISQFAEVFQFEDYGHVCRINSSSISFTNRDIFQYVISPEFLMFSVKIYMRIYVETDR